MVQVALAEEPLEVAVAERANSFAAQRGTLVAVAPRVGLMALLAMAAIDERSGGDGFGLAAEWVGAGMIFGRNVSPVRSGSCCACKYRAERNEQKCKAGPDHKAPPFEE